MHIHSILWVKLWLGLGLEGPSQALIPHQESWYKRTYTLRLKEIEKSHDEHSLVNSHSNTLSEKEEIIENVKFTPEKKRKRNRNKKIYRATYVGTGGRAASGTQSEIADSLIERNVDWRNEIMLR